MKPLVSILIPAYNAEEWIAETIQSALAQTWSRKEIIVVDDGSKDRTLEVAERFESPGVTVVSQANQGAQVARNHAYALGQGDYIQWLDADDLLAPDKIERQLTVLGETGRPRILLSCPRGHFYYRTSRAHFERTPHWQDLSPVEWLLIKMNQDVPAQTSTWLTSRELAEAAGPWDTRLLRDQDGEYFCRVLLASEGTRFVPEAKVFYRCTPPANRVSHVGSNNKKKDSLALSLKLHIKYLRSLEESERVRKACVTYLQAWFGSFFPDRPDLVAEMQVLAEELGGHLEPPRLRWKYAWMAPVFGSELAFRAQEALPAFKEGWIRRWERFMYDFERRGAGPRSREQGTGNGG